jgi:hypothetical protein
MDCKLPACGLRDWGAFVSMERRPHSLDKSAEAVSAMDAAPATHPIGLAAMIAERHRFG